MSFLGKCLGDVVDFIRGITFKPDDLVPPGDSGAVVCMRTKNIQELLDVSDLIAIPAKFVRREELFLQEGDILISSANSWNLVGKVAQVPALSYPATAGGFIAIVRAKRDAIDPQFLYRWLASDRSQAAIRACGRQTTNISNLSVSQFLNLPIAVPELGEQQRIATILDKADSLRRKRQEAIHLTDDLLRAVFIDMFGDPSSKNQRWPSVSIGDFVESIDTGWSAPSSDAVLSIGELGVLKVSAVSTGWFLRDEAKAVDITIVDRELVMPKKGDFLFSRANTRDLVAACCLVEEDCNDRFLPDKLWRINLNSDVGTNEYLCFLFRHPSFLRELTKQATGTSGSMLNISQAKLLQTSAPCPPIELQRQFSLIVGKAFFVRKRANDSLVETKALSTSLTNRFLA